MDAKRNQLPQLERKHNGEPKQAARQEALQGPAQRRSAGSIQLAAPVPTLDTKKLHKSLSAPALTKTYRYDSVGTTREDLVKMRLTAQMDQLSNLLREATERATAVSPCSHSVMGGASLYVVP